MKRTSRSYPRLVILLLLTAALIHLFFWLPGESRRPADSGTSINKAVTHHGGDATRPIEQQRAGRIAVPEALLERVMFDCISETTLDFTPEFIRFWRLSELELAPVREGWRSYFNRFSQLELLMAKIVFNNDESWIELGPVDELIDESNRQLKAELAAAMGDDRGRGAASMLIAKLRKGGRERLRLAFIGSPGDETFSIEYRFLTDGGGVWSTQEKHQLRRMSFDSLARWRHLDALLHSGADSMAPRH